MLNSLPYGSVEAELGYIEAEKFLFEDAVNTTSISEDEINVELGHFYPVNYSQNVKETEPCFFRSKDHRILALEKQLQILRLRLSRRETAKVELDGDVPADFVTNADKYWKEYKLAVRNAQFHENNYRMLKDQKDSLISRTVKAETRNQFLVSKGAKKDSKEVTRLKRKCNNFLRKYNTAKTTVQTLKNLLAANNIQLPDLKDD